MVDAAWLKLKFKQDSPAKLPGCRAGPDAGVTVQTP
jgi:hypothetical protein